MSKSHRSSHASEICRLEWRPSRLLAGGLMIAGALAAFAVLASDMPTAAAWLLACAAMLHGGWLAHRELRRPIATLVWNGHADVVSIDGVVVTQIRLQWRGPAVFLGYRDASGAQRRLAWWPDVLPARHRRELRLAAGMVPASRRRASMAP